MSTLPYVLIVWAVASDGLPTLPITFKPQPTLSACTIDKIAVQKKPATKAVCRLVKST